MVGWGERHAVDTTLVVAGRQFPHEPSRGGIPQTQAAAIGCGNQVPIRRKAVPEAYTSGTFQRPYGRTGIFQVPDSGRFVGAGTDEPLAVRRKTNELDRPLMALERP